MDLEVENFSVYLDAAQLSNDRVSYGRPMIYDLDKRKMIPYV